MPKEGRVKLYIPYPLSKLIRIQILTSQIYNNIIRYQILAVGISEFNSRLALYLQKFGQHFPCKFNNPENSTRPNLQQQYQQSYQQHQQPIQNAF